ncbi:helix-turn-helix transcriptional regulator, partial [Streptomyces sp. TRM72054]|uniref:helix-turn-helix domain-containing protein n=1 Tax=Streptomyces sp. TRM72054 TaxID=2870562 RepID=UPI001C8C3D16
LSMMNIILPGLKPLISDVRQSGSSPAQHCALPQDTVLLCLGRCIAAQARADYPAMLEASEALINAPPQRRRLFEALWMPLHVEALIRTGHLTQASNALNDLRTATRTYSSLTLQTGWLDGQLAQAHGDNTTVGRIYEEILGKPETANDHVLYRAFLEEAYGEHLAAQQQTDRAHTWLQRAQHRYTALHAQAFINRHNTETATMTSPPTSRVPSEIMKSPWHLTEREDQIAHFIGQGLTNKEIASQLFVSAKTVEYHLGNIYAKLNLANRRQLRDHIQGKPQTA